jgi:phosphoribosylanthranilate isomerase
MYQVRLKICGLRDNIEAVAALKPDYVGFIFYPKSPRYVGENFVVPRLPKGIKRVGVFVNEPLDEMVKITLKYSLDYAQLHGIESPEVCQGLKKKGIGVIKAFQMEEAFDFSQLEQYVNTVDYFLFDTKTKSYGGSGKTFNWEILKKYRMAKSYFLSGGIGMDNIEALNKIDLSKVHALDVNSRFELRPGLKDIRALRLLVNKTSIINSKIQSSKNK